MDILDKRSLRRDLDDVVPLFLECLDKDLPDNFYTTLDRFIESSKISDIDIGLIKRMTCPITRRSAKMLFLLLKRDGHVADNILKIININNCNELIPYAHRIPNLDFDSYYPKIKELFLMRDRRIVDVLYGIHRLEVIYFVVACSIVAGSHIKSMAISVISKRVRAYYENDLVMPLTDTERAIIFAYNGVNKTCNELWICLKRDVVGEIYDKIFLTHMFMSESNMLHEMISKYSNLVAKFLSDFQKFSEEMDFSDSDEKSSEGTYYLQNVSISEAEEGIKVINEKGIAGCLEHPSSNIPYLIREISSICVNQGSNLDLIFDISFKKKYMDIMNMVIKKGYRIEFIRRIDVKNICDYSEMYNDLEIAYAIKGERSHANHRLHG